MSQLWAAGLFEGEGCFTVSKTGGRKYFVMQIISMHARDRDVLDRLAGIMGVGNVTGPHKNGMCRWAVGGTKAEALVRDKPEFIANLGARRQARLDECRAEVRSQPAPMSNHESGKLAAAARWGWARA